MNVQKSPMSNSLPLALLTISLGLVSTVTPALAQIPAFPDAEGGGAAAVGGRGGQVIEVTSLGDDGPGTLREALLTPGPRIIVFRVGGTIELESAIWISGEPYSYVTIAGQTAPGGGVLVSGQKSPESGIMFNNAHDIVIRYLRGRKGYNSNQQLQTGDPIVLADGVYNAIVDHCSVSWTSDQNMSVWSSSNPAHDITFQWNLFGEPLSSHPTSIIVGSGTNTEGMLDIDIHHNLFITPGHRLPNFKGKRGRIINNLAYNWGWRATGFSGGVVADVIGNIYIKGPATMAQSTITEVLWRMGGDGQSGGPLGDPSIYIAGNTGHTNADPAADNWHMIAECTGWTPTNNPMNPSYRRNAPLDGGAFPITVHSATNLEELLREECGAYRQLNGDGSWVDNRDAVDGRLIEECRTRSGGQLPVTEDDVGGFPVIPSGSPYPDTDHDGMADEWETAHDLDPNDPTDGNQDADLDGYTNVEEFLNGLEANPDNTPPTVVATATPTAGMAPLSVQFSADASDEDGQIVSYSWHFGDGAESTEKDPAHTFVQVQDYEVTVTVTDNEDATAAAVISVSVTDDAAGGNGGAGPPDGSQDQSGCGCGTHHTNSQWSLGILVLIALGLRRSRASWAL